MTDIFKKNRKIKKKGIKKEIKKEIKKKPYHRHHPSSTLGNTGFLKMKTGIKTGINSEKTIIN